METVSQAAYARDRGVSRQYIGKLVKAGKIQLTEDKKIDPAAADAAIQANADPARKLGEEGQSGAADTGAQPTGQGGLSFANSRAERESYQAKMAALEYDRAMGRILDKQQVLDAMTTSGRAIRQGLDGIIGWADDLDAAARNGGPQAVRSVLRAKVREVETMIVERLNLFGDETDEG